jgi:hypothetical protein
MPLKQALSGVPPPELPLTPAEAGIDPQDAVATQAFIDLRDKGYAVVTLPEPQFDDVAEQVRTDLGDRFDWDYWRSTGHRKQDGLRIQDAWMYSEAVRRIAINPGMLSLLERLYGRRAIPFQTLNFPVGTQQAAHSDHVHFATVPERWMVGVWVALEDVSADAGPLEYFEGSHRAPFFHPEQVGAAFSYAHYLRLWQTLCEHYQFPRRSFLARKGQALIWAANLIHGGSPQHDASLTRWSQVTHYYFDNCLYYTPIESNIYAGKMLIRSPTNIVTGKEESGSLFGLAIDASHRQFFSLDRLVSLPPGFSAAKYLAANPDVAAARVDPIQHYLRYGFFEGRRIE